MSVGAAVGIATDQLREEIGAAVFKALFHVFRQDPSALRNLATRSSIFLGREGPRV